jgi:hypothetical protein
MAGPFDGGRPARLDALAVGARESVRDVHAGHERAVAAGTGRVTVEVTWPNFRASLPLGLLSLRVGGLVISQGRRVARRTADASGVRSA